MSGDSTRAAVPSLTYGRQCIEQDDIDAVVAVLKADWLTQGPAVEAFEAALAARFDVPHAVVCATGTAALHLAALGLEWQAGDVIIVPAITFLASANCAAYVGAEPVFVDIDPVTGTIDVGAAESEIVRQRAAGRRVRALVAVDMGGHPCDWPALRALADRHDLQLLDDACHAMGSRYRGIETPSCRHADAAVLSFHPVKHITTAEGGALLTRDPGIASRARLMRSHGTVRGPEAVAGWEGPWHYDMVDLGFNFRLTDLQSALGLSQLRKLDRFVDSRRRLAAAYDTRFASSSVFLAPRVAAWAEHSYHLYLLRAPFGDGLPPRRQFFERCAANGVHLQVHYRPVPLNSYYRQGRRVDEIGRALPQAMRFYQEVCSIPMYPQLSIADVDRVVSVLHEAVGQPLSRA